MPAALGSACAPVGDPHLAQVVGRHLEAVGGEALLHRLQRRLVGVRCRSPAARPRRRRSGRPPSGPRPPGGDDEVDLRPQPHQRRPDRLRVVGDDHLLGQLVPELEQPLGDEGVVGVAHLPPQHLVPDRQQRRPLRHRLGTRHLSSTLARRRSGCQRIVSAARSAARRASEQSDLRGMIDAFGRRRYAGWSRCVSATPRRPTSA